MLLLAGRGAGGFIDITQEYVPEKVAYKHSTVHSTATMLLVLGMGNSM